MITKLVTIYKNDFVGRNSPANVRFFEEDTE